MKYFKEALRKISSTLTGSIIAISSEEDNFVYSAKDVTDESQFYIGSLTKRMTAFMFLTAVKNRNLTKDLSTFLAKTLSEAFPKSELLNSIDRPWINDITLLDLLTHRSGLSDYIEVYEKQLKQAEALNITIDPIKIIQSVKWDALKKYHYSNTNYFLLGKLIEEMLQCNFGKCFDTMIKGPLKMTCSFAPVLGNYHAFKKEDCFARLIPDLNNKIFIDMGNAVGTGNIISSISDLLKWNHFVHNEMNLEFQQIMLKNYFQDGEDDDWINLGSSTEETNMGPLVGFQGAQDSYCSFLGFFPKYKLNIVILSNNSEDYLKLFSVLENIPDPILTKERKIDKEEHLFFIFSEKSRALVALGIDIPHSEASNNQEKPQSYLEKIKSKTLGGRHWEM